MKVIHICRKPLSESSVAENVRKHGTGALNIDACRVGTEQTIIGVRRTRFKGTHYAGGAVYEPPEDAVGDRLSGKAGRWPSNLILEHLPECGGTAGNCAPGCPVTELDTQSGEVRSAGNHPTQATRCNNNVYGAMGDGENRWQGPLYADKGGASRFFKQVGGSKAEK